MRQHEAGDPAWISDIRNAAAIIAHRMLGIRLPDFVADLSLQDGIVMRLIIIGEAAKNLSGKTRNAFRQIPWKDIAKFRDLSIHHY